MKEGSLFCFVVMRSTKLGCFWLCSQCPWKVLDKEVHGLGSMTFGLVVQKFLNIEWFFSLKLKLNCGWNLVGKIWIYIMGDIDFEVIFATKNSNKFQKTRFWKNKSVESVVTLEGLPFNSSMISFHIQLFKKSIHTL